jgi:hypothetical protein
MPDKRESATATTPESGSEVAPFVEPDTSLIIQDYSTRGLSDDFLADIHTFEDAFSAMETAGYTAEDWADYGTGFEVLDSNGKARLVGVPFAILEWRFNDGDMGTFVSCMLVTKANEKLVMNDGSTGIRDQLAQVTRKRVEKGHPEPQKGPFYVRQGLSRSDYKVEIPDTKTGEMVSIPATTFYLAN